MWMPFLRIPAENSRLEDMIPSSRLGHAKMIFSSHQITKRNILITANEKRDGPTFHAKLNNREYLSPHIVCKNFQLDLLKIL